MTVAGLGHRGAARVEPIVAFPGARLPLAEVRQVRSTFEALRAVGAPAGSLAAGRAP